MRPLADKVLENQKNKDTKVNFVPSRFEKTMNHWMEITYDWCISRQLWWGHRIPAWYKGDEVYVGINPPKEDGWVQDKDVLDTWFSSALWPFATLGFPDETEDYKRYYPNDVLVTGYDIIPFWVNRMTFQSLKFTKKAPFKDCLIHGLIRDKMGRKMSKSLGNGVDPMDVIDKYGCDALRYFLTTSSAPGMDLRYDEEKVKSSWNFINKLWNASRFVLMNVEDINKENYTLENLSIIDKWILNKLNNVIKISRKHMEKYEFNVVGSELYSFIWNDFCDWYIELSKHSMNNTTKSVLIKVLTDILKLIHPFMPFVTEEIYSALPIKDSESIMISSYPIYEKKYSFDVKLDYTLELITKIRKVKLENNIKEYYVYYKNLDNIDILTNMLKLSNTNFITEKNNLREIVIDKDVSVLYDGSENLEKELENLRKEKERLESSIKRRENLLNNPNYVSKAPESIVEQERKNLEKERENLDALLNKLN